VALFTATRRILCVVRDETSIISIVHVWRRAVTSGDHQRYR